MSGYLHFAREKEDSPAGRILGLLHQAGNAYHHTSDWTQTDEWTPVSYTDQLEGLVCGECDRQADEIERLRAIMARGCRMVDACGHTASCECCWCNLRKLMVAEAAKDYATR